MAAARQAIAERGPRRLTLSAVAAAAGVSRPTLYRWFPTKDDLLAAVTTVEKQQFDVGLEIAIESHRAPARRLDAALRYLVLYLDASKGPNPIGVDPAYALQSLERMLTPQVDALVRLLDGALDEIPSVGCGQITRDQAAEVLVRLAYSHYVVPSAEPEMLLMTIRRFAGLATRSLRQAAG